MNADEGVSLFKMVVTVLLVVLVVGAIVGLTYAAYSWFNSGTSKLTDQVASIDKSGFSQYDDTTVVGTDVLSALKTYRESEIAIFIVNKNDADNKSADVYKNIAKEGQSIKAWNYCALADKDGAGTPVDAVTNSKGNGYRAALAVSAAGTTKGKWCLNQNVAYGLAWKDGVLQRNTNFSPTTTKAMTQTYVNQSATWYCKLVYDPSTNDICGILFVQMN